MCTGIVGEKQTANAIYDGDNYLEVFQRDLLEATKNIVISSPIISGEKVYKLISLLKKTISWIRNHNSNVETGFIWIRGCKCSFMKK